MREFTRPNKDTWAGVGLVWSFAALLLSACDTGTVAAGKDAGSNTVDSGVAAEQCAEVEGCVLSPCAGDDAVYRPQGWSLASHCNNVEPDYTLLFDDSDLASLKVHRFDILISAEAYQQSQDDLARLYGTPVCNGGTPSPPTPGSDENPMWVPVTVKFNDLTWWHVGMRYKGNSSLRSAWQTCIKKLAFRLDFDEFEDAFPSVKNQRFYGFKKMTFSNAFKDTSLLRDKLGADIFRRAGIPAARGAFAAVYVTIEGQEPTYFGLYTMIEDPSDRMLEVQFADASGNLYKPEGSRDSRAAHWDGSASVQSIVADFAKQTNEDAGDWSDVIAAVAALNADTRLSDAAAWRVELEARFDVERFLTVLAVNQSMVNWDSYGCMPHNYYVYADPADPTAVAPAGRLTWFPWDLNESMLVSGMCNLSSAPGLIPSASVISADWPLIRFVLDDAQYAALYRQALEQVIAAPDGAFASDWVKARLAAYHDLIAAYVVGPQAHETQPYTFLRSDAEFTSSAEQLQSFVDARHQLVRDVLGL